MSDVAPTRGRPDPIRHGTAGLTRSTTREILPEIEMVTGVDGMRGRIMAVAEVTAAGLIAGDDGRRYGYGLTDLRSSAPQAGDAVDFHIDARPDLPVDPAKDIGSARDVSLVPGALPVSSAAAPIHPRPDWTTFYLSPSGRVGLGDYWLYGVMILFAVNIFVGWIPILGQIVSLVAGWAGIALAIRRCHDVDRSGWWIWLPFAPLLAALATIPLALAEAYNAAVAVGALCGTLCLIASAGVFFTIMIRRGDREANRFGPPPVPIKP